MPEKIAIELGEIQKTLLLPLWGRAQETAKTHPALVDRAAQELVARLDFDFPGLTAGISPLTQAAWVMRAVRVDQVIHDFLQESPRAVILNLGCGLDTTFERVDNGQLTWFDLDLPDVIALRRQLIPENPRRQLIASSFLDPLWLQGIKAPGRLLVVAAGVFYYAERRDVRHFLVRLAGRFACQVLFDVCSPLGMRVANRRVLHNRRLGTGAQLKWGLRDPRDLLKWDPRFRLLHTYSYFGANASHLPLNLRLAGLISDALQIQYMLHLGL